MIGILRSIANRRGRMSEWVGGSLTWTRTNDTSVGVDGTWDVLEDLALRQQLAVLHRSAKRLHLDCWDRGFWGLIPRIWYDWLPPRASAGGAVAFDPWACSRGRSVAPFCRRFPSLRFFDTLTQCERHRRTSWNGSVAF
jgi:hypothetical protein